MRQLSDLSAISNILINKRLNLRQYIRPETLRRYRFKGVTFSEKGLFELAQGIVNEIGIKTDYQHRKCIEKSINKFAINGNAVLTKISSIYNKSDYFDLIIHGSYADNTYTPASDIDDFVILKKEAFDSFEIFKETQKILSQLNLYYQMVDPVQHHGHWIFTEFDLLNFNQCTMPVCIFEDAISIGKDLNLKIYINDDEFRQGFLDILGITLITARRELDILFSNKSNLYGLKSFISDISLLIPLIFQIKGELLSKKTAILRANEILDDRAMRVLNWCTNLRKNWDKLPTIEHYRVVRLFLKFIQNRSIVESLSNKYLPSLNVIYITENIISKEDFDHFFFMIESLSK